MIVKMTELTLKELSAIEDTLQKETIMMKKYQSMAPETGNKKLSELFSHNADIHKKHINMLLSYLK